MDLSEDRFMRKNQSMARAYDEGRKGNQRVLRRDIAGQEREEKKSCFNCKLRSKCDIFRRWRTGGTTGVVSVNADQEYICDRWIEDPVDRAKGFDASQVRGLLRGARKGRI